MLLLRLRQRYYTVRDVQTKDLKLRGWNGLKGERERKRERKEKRNLPLPEDTLFYYFYYYFHLPWELRRALNDARRPIIFDLFSCERRAGWLFPAALIILRWWGIFFNLRRCHPQVINRRFFCRVWSRLFSEAFGLIAKSSSSITTANGIPFWLDCVDDSDKGIFNQPFGSNQDFSF